MFYTARWRLTLWFVLVLGAIVAVTGVAVYFTTRAALFDQVNSDLKSRVRQERPSLAGQLAPPAPEPPRDISIGPQFPVGGYFYALVDSSGAVLTTNPSVVTRPASPMPARLTRRSAAARRSPTRSHRRETPCGCTSCVCRGQATSNS